MAMAKRSLFLKTGEGPLPNSPTLVYSSLIGVFLQSFYTLYSLIRCRATCPMLLFVFRLSGTHLSGARCDRKGQGYNRNN